MYILFGIILCIILFLLLIKFNKNSKKKLRYSCKNIIVEKNEDNNVLSRLWKSHYALNMPIPMREFDHDPKIGPLEDANEPLLYHDPIYTL